MSALGWFALRIAVYVGLLLVAFACGIRPTLAEMLAVGIAAVLSDSIGSLR